MNAESIETHPLPRLNRREFLSALLASTALGAITGSGVMIPADALAQSAAANPAPSFNFKELAAGSDDKHHVAEGYDTQILIRWGDPVLADAPPFDPMNQSAAAQAKQFGYNNDFVGFVPLNGSSEHGILVVNHEYTNEELMFPKLGRQDGKTKFARVTKEIAEIEMMAVGGSILEIKRENGKWGVVNGSKYARRITAHTPMAITGPASGHALMKTGADPSGTTVLGMLNLCAGGMTPWGTWLVGEENVNGNFWGKAEGPNEKAMKRYATPGNSYNWGQYFDRFDVAKEPNEINRFGWIVEIDPIDPASTPRKRTALGRFKHEGAGVTINKDGRAIAYLGDDERFDYIYKFVSDGKFDPANRAANLDLLEKGTLYVARFNADGSGDWLPLVHGQGKLTPENGFANQGQVVIHARLAGDALGATKMDRCEEIDVNPKTGKIYAMLSNNNRRTPEQVHAANPRANNRFGHIIEMIADGGDHAAPKFAWTVLVKCGDPAKPEHGASFHPATSKNGWFGMPDNCAFDNQGRLWVATDGNSRAKTGRNDGIWALETEGAARGIARHFFRCPDGAEMCGPWFTPNDETFFVAVQHPGEGDEDGGVDGTYETPAHPLAGFQPGHAAAAIHRGDHQKRRRPRSRFRASLPG